MKWNEFFFKIKNKLLKHTQNIYNKLNIFKSLNNDSTFLTPNKTTNYSSDVGNSSNSLFSYKSTSYRSEYLEKREKKNFEVLKSNDLVFFRWENALQPWTEHHCKKWIS